MSAALAPSPVRLPAENPNGLVTFWDMLRFNAHHFVAASGNLGHIIMDIQSGNLPKAESARMVDDTMKLLVKQLDELGLAVSVEQAKRISAYDSMQRFFNTRDPQELQVLGMALRELQQRMCDEMGLRIFFQISPEKARYYEPSSAPFGQEVFDRFPSAIDDVLEAGNCLALGRNTAVVFHLMRVLELAFKVLAHELGIPYAPSWESYLRQISKIVEADWKSKTDSEKARLPLYKDLAGDIQSIKIAWRNPTMHIVKKYTADESVQIYNCVRQFMTRFAGAGFSE